jgi:hypothetical protein
MDTKRQQKLAELAPLTVSVAMHLATSLMKTQPRSSGRPRKDAMDVTARTEMRLLEAMDQLIALVRDKRQMVFDLINTAVTAERLHPRWLMQTLIDYMPDDAIMYPQRLREWRRNLVLFTTTTGLLDPQSVSCILLARMIDQRKSGWLPHPPTNESYWAWRLDQPVLNPYPYELPITQIDPQRPGVVSRTITPAEQVYVLYTPWKGATWDSSAWMLVEDRAIRWVGEPDESIVSRWLSAQELEQLSTPGRADGSESSARQALRLLASRLIHVSSSNSSSRPM